MAKMSKNEKVAERRANAVAQSACVGFQIPIMELSKVATKAKEACGKHASDVDALAEVRAFIATIAKAA